MTIFERLRMTDARPRFPVILTLATFVALVILLGLGVWQVQRLQLKDRLTKEIMALEKAPAQPIGPVLARAANGADVQFTRVSADCAGAAMPGPTHFEYGIDRGAMVWRPLAPCRVDAPPFDGVVINRGVLDAARGATAPPVMTLPSPRHVVGLLLRSVKLPTVPGLHTPAPLLLVVESEAPAAPGVTPAPLPGAGLDSIERYGEGVLVWFGLAVVLVCFYAAMLWRRFRP
jgi:surfeit locus 1 family protein